MIEDNETMRDGISQILGGMGHPVTAVAGGPQGVDICRKREIDLVITDYKMQQMNGIEVLESHLAETQFFSIPSFHLTPPSFNS